MFNPTEDQIEALEQRSLRLFNQAFHAELANRPAKAESLEAKANKLADALMAFYMERAGADQIDLLVASLAIESEAGNI
jgi:hypothetical protein